MSFGYSNGVQYTFYLAFEIMISRVFIVFPLSHSWYKGYGWLYMTLAVTKGYKTIYISIYLFMLLEMPIISGSEC
jgi:hypothetical protein